MPMPIIDVVDEESFKIALARLLTGCPATRCKRTRQRKWDTPH
jgi:hypothetical protein